jgi:hypothetical protein
MFPIRTIKKFQNEKVSFEHHTANPKDRLIFENPIIWMILNQPYLNGLYDLRNKFYSRFRLDVVNHMSDTFPNIFNQVKNFKFFWNIFPGDVNLGNGLRIGEVKLYIRIFFLGCPISFLICIYGP